MFLPFARPIISGGHCFVPTYPVSRCCLNLVPGILWDTEVIEKRAFSLRFIACPADFANKNQLLGWFMGR